LDISTDAVEFYSAKPVFTSASERRESLIRVIRSEIMGFVRRVYVSEGVVHSSC
jgi:hypothetical protein